MRKLLYIVIALFVFASCDHEMDNWPDVDTGAAVPSIKLAEGSNSYMDFDNISETEVVYDLTYISKKHKVKEMDIKIVYDNGTKKDTFDYGTITTFPAKLIVNADKMDSASGGIYTSETIKPGDNISLFVSEFTLSNGTKITPTTTYTVKTADSLEDFVVENYSGKIQNSVFYAITSKLYVTATPHGIVPGEYTVLADGEDLLEGQKVTWTVDGPNLTCTHLFGGYWLPHDIIQAELIDLGIGQGIKVLSSPSWVWPILPITKLEFSVDPETKIITIDYADGWGNTGIIVHTPV